MADRIEDRAMWMAQAETMGVSPDVAAEKWEARTPDTPAVPEQQPLDDMTDDAREYRAICEMQEEITRLRTALATATNDALERAAMAVDAYLDRWAAETFGQEISPKYAAEYITKEIRALKQETNNADK